MNQAKMPAMKARPLPKNARPAITSVLNKAENFERDHRQDARHEIEDETANEAEKKETGNVSRCRILVSAAISGQLKCPRHCDPMRQRNFQKRSARVAI